MSRRPPTTYWDYIKVEQLLGLQTGIDGDESKLSNEEVLFIVVHQVDELWFKLVIRELVAVRDLLAAPFVPEQSLSDAVRRVRRAELLVRKVADHFEVMETLTTRDYLAFRDKLSPASGFQSAQMREIEVLLGLEASERIPLGGEKSYLDALRNHDGTPSPAYERVVARIEDRPTLKEAVQAWLLRTPIGGVPHDHPEAEARLGAFVDGYIEAYRAYVGDLEAQARVDARTAEDAERLARRYRAEADGVERHLRGLDVSEEERTRVVRIRAAVIFLESYRELPLLAWPRELVDGLVALEQACVVFRQRHARMVERIIGRRTGTGGSAGVAYLDETALRYRVFGELWAARTMLLPRHRLPDVVDATYYDFAGGQ
ncbi:MAG: tryptophan 2,3-dioxygenase [Deltaproteobacteria bacterium]|nr:MAG: tryptophan 2,3-dioxygenase [Deltaproteobacteria bacterium]